MLNYDALTGILTWKYREDVPKKWNTRYAGSIAGSQSFHGTIISIHKERLRAHRVIWLWMTGSVPVRLIDHKNLNPNDNRWENLREATSSQNLANTRARSTNKIGLKGVSWSAKENKWQVSITKDYKQRRVGTFDCPAAAHFAYLLAAINSFGEFARGS